MTKSPTRKLNVRPDSPDFRDLPFRPNIALAPQPELFPEYLLGIKDQNDTSACTGFSLSLVVEYLLRKAHRETAPTISPYMLYSMARRYDEFPGSRDEGSSLRGALKGWHKHGACADSLWKTGINMPKAPKKPQDDWWLDAVNRPLGAYYRIDPKQISDIHAALNEVGIVYASTDTHAGWDKGNNLKHKKPHSFKDKLFVIPHQAGSDGGHAIAITGYNEFGFLIQNSWGPSWGSAGYAILTYEDWLVNAMDCWVAQLGVVTQDHKIIASSNTLRTNSRGNVALAAGSVLRNREISPFVINMGNNGQLSNSGMFRTSEEDIKALVDVHLAEARERWNPGNKPIDVCIYAHGGLVGEQDAANNAAEWISMLYDNQIFPVYLMWETGFLSTVVNRITDAIKDVPRTVGGGEGFWSRTERWWNERVERLLAQPGTLLWDEMKQNAEAISKPGKVDGKIISKSGAVMLYAAFSGSSIGKLPVRFHLVGHSAGSIVHTHIIDALADKIKFESVSFLAPAVRHDTFDKYVKPRLTDGTIKRYQQFHLTEKAEEDDPTCGPYTRSLLNLVAESFEGGKRTPILGMRKYFDVTLAKLKNVTIYASPGKNSTSATHGGFDSDEPTKKSVLRFIKQ
jgi:Papain family cysteine protease